MKVQCMECEETFRANFTDDSEPECPECGSFDIDLAV
jgi:DNA-directed RNA polymerase subunit RPC12/RpoP